MPLKALGSSSTFSSLNAEKISTRKETWKAHKVCTKLMSRMRERFIEDLGFSESFKSALAEYGFVSFSDLIGF